jgi:hypothetical protein
MTTTKPVLSGLPEPASDIDLATFQQSRNVPTGKARYTMNYNPPLPVEPEILTPRIGSACGWSRPKKPTAVINGEQSGYEKMTAIITDTAVHGPERMRQEQRRQIVEAATGSAPMPPTPPLIPDLQNYTDRQIEVLTEERRKHTLAAAPAAIELLEDFQKVATRWLDTILDAESELAARLGFPFKPSPTSETLQYVLREVVAGKIKSLRDPKHLHGSPKSMTLGLVQ